MRKIIFCSSNVTARYTIDMQSGATGCWYAYTRLRWIYNKHVTQVAFEYFTR